jgi:5-formyltetrahydrofolate cyclo-ligase
MDGSVPSPILVAAERSEAAFARPNHESRSVDGAAERSEAAPSTPAGYPVGAGASFNPTDSVVAERAVRVVVHERLKRAGEWLYARGRCDHPPFRSAPVAAANLLGLLPAGLPLLVLRDPVLRPLRELALEQGYPLVLPDKSGGCVYRVPRTALFAADGRRLVAALRIDPLPFGSEVYSAPVGAVVVGCLSFDPRLRRLCSFDSDRTAAVLDGLRDGLASGFTLAPNTLVIALAHDCQLIENMPSCAFGFTEADLVVTPTRVFLLGSGEQFPAAYLREVGHVG